MPASTLPVTAAAIGLALLGAVCFAAAAVLQHRGVARATRGGEDLPVSAVGSLATDRVWLAGTGFVAVGGLLHVGALALAPVTLVQPVGVLAVPLACLFAAPGLHRLSPEVLRSCLLTVGAVGAFVVLVGSGSAGTVDPVDASAALPLDLAASGDVVVAFGLITAGLGALAVTTTGIARCLAYGAAAAVAFGGASALLRAAFVVSGAGQAGPVELLTLGALVLAGFGVGAWLVQRAYASGPAAVVLGTLTVVDPVAAAAFGVAALGEAIDPSPLRLAGIAVAALLAIVGVARLSRHHPRPDASPRPAERHPVPA